MAERCTQVDRVYGVLPGYHVTAYGFELYEVDILPSKTLLSDLTSLPEGTVVGLEVCDPKEVQELSTNVSKGVLANTKPTEYWKVVAKACKRSNLQVAYLDDFATHKLSAANSAIVVSHRRALIDKSTVYPRTEKVEDEMRGLRGEMYKAEVEAKYIHVVRRGEAILRRMRDLQPRVAIISEGFADYLAVNSDIFSSDGLSVGEFKKEKVIKDSHLLNPPKRFRQAILAEHYIPNPQNSLEIELIKRKDSAVIKGLVTAAELPDYIGSWDSDCPARGLFEMFIKGGEIPSGGEFSGRIEDSLGTADFIGKVGFEGSIFFEKTYRRDQSDRSAAEGKIRYSGLRKDNSYRGKYYLEKVDQGLDFILNKVQ